MKKKKPHEKPVADWILGNLNPNLAKLV